MKRILPQKDYGTCKRNVQEKIDEIFAERVIAADDSVRLLDQIVEEIDISPLMKAYSDIGRKPKNTPRTMLKVMLYVAMESIYSSSRIHSACERDINFIWLLNGEPTPSYQDIAWFRSLRLSECMEELFYQFVEKLREYEEIKHEHLFVDGTKMEANANKYSFVWKKSTNKYEARLDQKLEKLLPELCVKYAVAAEGIEELLSALEEKVNFSFMYGRG